ncbi:hypothetical protein RPMA_10865 [Tardiphaga alba]|uniref:Uncharacterized protein n=1 Tax=Tardiphaga alba TaxID=340268 RepID=A0ABX8AA64_9BRAD|nr:hypothetical protein [Tardiphaga alba]QUS39280.1 hypothetical protein RPMA_10865 [Tardiphaga alba]
MAEIDTPHTTHTIQEIIARELDKFELEESAFNASDRRERAAALGLPLSLDDKADRARREPSSSH